jgi:hypothetical protein
LETIQLTKKKSQMKKFLLVLSIGAFTLAFAACNNSASTEAKDSTKMASDSSKMATDSSKMATDSSKMAMDTTKKDSTKK